MQTSEMKFNRTNSLSCPQSYLTHWWQSVVSTLRKSYCVFFNDSHVATICWTLFIQVAQVEFSSLKKNVKQETLSIVCYDQNNKMSSDLPRYEHGIKTKFGSVLINRTHGQQPCKRHVFWILVAIDRALRIDVEKTCGLKR